MKTISSKRGSRQVSRPTQMGTKGNTKPIRLVSASAKEGNGPSGGPPLNDSTQPGRRVRAEVGRHYLPSVT